MARALRFFFVLVLLAGCAEVTVTPLTPAGKVDEKQEEGVRYYHPKPYLLVTNLPAETPAAAVIEKQDTPATKGNPPAAPSKPQSPADTSGDTSKTPPASVSDLSFIGATKQYIVKLIYLPDYSKPYAIRGRTGLVGSSQMTVQLQDGWMMTSLSASSDSKAAETISAVASLVSSLGGVAASAMAPGVGGAAKTPKQAIDGGKAELVLYPGLYGFKYKDNGQLKGLEAITYFCPDGPRPSGGEAFSVACK